MKIKNEINAPAKNGNTIFKLKDFSDSNKNSYCPISNNKKDPETPGRSIAAIANNPAMKMVNVEWDVCIDSNDAI